MPRVYFKFNNGKERTMPVVLADVLSRRGMGEYLTRDMVASARPLMQPMDSISGQLVAEEELDSAGFVWNPEIHVASKLKNQNGTWRKKPNNRASSESAE